MAWTRPKTDWARRGFYPGTSHPTGDYFNAVDYNRIKNNVQWLADAAVAAGYSVTISDMGADKAVNDFFYADEINTIVTNLKAINNATFHIVIPGTIPTYSAYGKVFSYNDLILIEWLTKSLHDRLATGQYLLPYTLGFGLGIMEGY